MLFAAGVRSDGAPLRTGETTFEFLDRVEGDGWGRVRELLNDWHDHLPTDACPDLEARMRSDDRRHFDGAFFELYCHETLRRLRFSVSSHPENVTERGAPDFLASGSEHVILEATVAAASDDTEAAERREERVYEAINGIATPNFSLFVDVEEAGDYSPPTRELCGQLEQWLSTLDPDQVSRIAEEEGGLLLAPNVPSFSWSDGRGWSLSFRPFPRKPEARGAPGLRPIGMYGPQGAFTDDAGRLRKAVRDKAGAYGNLAHAFVIAVRCAFGTDDYDVMAALYGSENVTFGVGPDGATVTQTGRDSDGMLWGPRGPRSRRVSAVLVVTALEPWTVGRCVPWFFPHPDPLIDVGLEGAPWVRYEPSTRDDQGLLQLVDAPLTPAEFFGLAPDWPGPLK